MSEGQEARPLGYPKTHRLRKRRQFDVVYDKGVNKHAGVLRVVGRPNGLEHCRLGLNVSKRVGNAVKRSRIKRYLRESFRLQQWELPRGLDLVVIAKPHEVLKLEDYQRMLMDAAKRIEGEWKRRAERKSDERDGH